MDIMYKEAFGFLQVQSINKKNDIIYKSKKNFIVESSSFNKL